MSWETIRLGDFLNLKRGYDLPNAVRKDGNVPIVSSSGVTGFHNEAKVTGPGVVTGRYGTLGEVYYVKEDYWPLNTALYVEDFKGSDPHFTAYFLKTVLSGTSSDKAAVPGVNRNDLHARKVHVTRNFDLQRRIAAILSAYDDLIETNRRRIALLGQAARLIYREWFVHLRFPGHEAVRVVDGAPAGWESGTVADFFTTTSGGTPSRDRPEYFLGDIPWIKTQELGDCYIFGTQECITEEAIAGSSAKLLPVDTVLVAMYGATIGQTGILAVPSTCNQACCAILPRIGASSHVFAFLFFLENKQGLISLAQGAAQNNISQQIIKKYPMLMPNSAIFSQFVAIVEPLLQQVKTLSASNKRLVSARDLLLPRLMNGEIEV